MLLKWVSDGRADTSNLENDAQRSLWTGQSSSWQSREQYEDDLHRAQTRDPGVSQMVHEFPATEPGMAKVDVHAEEEEEDSLCSRAVEPYSADFG